MRQEVRAAVFGQAESSEQQEGEAVAQTQPQNTSLSAKSAPTQPKREEVCVQGLEPSVSHANALLAEVNQAKPRWQLAEARLVEMAAKSSERTGTQDLRFHEHEIDLMSQILANKARYLEDRRVMLELQKYQHAAQGTTPPSPFVLNTVSHIKLYTTSKRRGEGAQRKKRRLSPRYRLYLLSLAACRCSLAACRCSSCIHQPHPNNPNKPRRTIPPLELYRAPPHYRASTKDERSQSAREQTGGDATSSRGPN